MQERVFKEPQTEIKPCAPKLNHGVGISYIQNHFCMGFRSLIFYFYDITRYKQASWTMYCFIQLVGARV